MKTLLSCHLATPMIKLFPMKNGINLTKSRSRKPYLIMSLLKTARKILKKKISDGKLNS